MNGDTGVDYLQPWTIGETIVGLSGVGMIVKSANPSYSAGDIVYSFLRWPWTLYFARKAADITGFQKAGTIDDQLCESHLFMMQG